MEIGKLLLIVGCVLFTLVYTFFFALTIYILKYKRPEAGYGNLNIIIMSVLFLPYWMATGIEYLIDKFYKK
jgi:hypothetical protein